MLNYSLCSIIIVFHCASHIEYVPILNIQFKRTIGGHISGQCNDHKFNVGHANARIYKMRLTIKEKERVNDGENIGQRSMTEMKGLKENVFA